MIYFGILLFFASFLPSWLLITWKYVQLTSAKFEYHRNFAPFLETEKTGLFPVISTMLPYIVSAVDAYNLPLALNRPKLCFILQLRTSLRLLCAPTSRRRHVWEPERHFQVWTYVSCYKFLLINRLLPCASFNLDLHVKTFANIRAISSHSQGYYPSEFHYGMLILAFRFSTPMSLNQL